MSHRYPEHIADKTVNLISDRAPALMAHESTFRVGGPMAYMGDMVLSAHLVGLEHIDPADPLAIIEACTRTGAPKPEELAVWRMWGASRAVYRFDGDLADALAETDGTAGLSLDEIEAMLPLECFFVEEPIEAEVVGEVVACRGFFAVHPMHGLIQLSYVDKSASIVRSDTVRTKDADVGAAVQTIMDEDAHMGYDQIEGYDAEVAHDTTRAAMTRALASIAYLETPDAEVVKVGTTPAPSRRHRGGSGTTPSWRVGSAIGGRMRAYDASRGGGEHGTGGTVRPHMRRAHWSHYWVGPRDGERRLEPRWIHPVMVNGGAGDTPDTTVVHPVRRAGNRQERAGA